MIERFWDLGTREHPLHASSLDALLRCPWFFVGRLMELWEDEPGEPAHTGIACARAIELWHRGKDLRAALEQTKVEAFGERPFSLADWPTVDKIVARYAADPRNAPDSVAKTEEKLVGEVVPGLWVVGRYDQIRRTGDRLLVWDLKAGRNPEPWSYAAQLAAYSALAEVEVGGLITLRDYVRKTGVGSVFRPLALCPDACRVLLESVRLEVERLREGIVAARPCVACRYCRFGGPEECLRLLALGGGR